ncbi:DUF2652 domain-containing protein [Tepidamorphus sp. 3E244]|uniref:DUF2652 domain-containing protein n=1 Tax=Tepidamorphus sp. 3E244 TaxID=3385498 RepID=UPI0038FC93FF
MSDGWLHMAPMTLGLVLLLAVVVAAAVFFLRMPRNQSLLSRDLSPSNHGWGAHLPFAKPAQSGDSSQDTIFVLPDISNYTRFMTGNTFALGHARYVVFSLIDAMVDAACRTMKLSKLEGDAALFYADAGKLSPEQAGNTVLAIMDAFFREQTRLVATNKCPCSTCTQIADLDLKVFVHRGKAARFEYRGVVDHFGTDVIIIHRLMKNGVGSHRYVMVTEAARDAIRLPAHLSRAALSEVHEHIGAVEAHVYDLTGKEPPFGSRPEETSRGALADWAGKFRQNARSITDTFTRRAAPRDGQPIPANPRED